MRGRRLRGLVAALCVCFLLAPGAAHAWFGWSEQVSRLVLDWTEQVPRTILQRVAGLFGVALELGPMEGSLPSGLKIERLAWSGADGMRVEVQGATVQLQPGRLLATELRIVMLHAERVDVQLPKPAQDAKPAGGPLQLPANLGLPVSIDLQSLHVHALHVRGDDGVELPIVRDLRASFRADAKALELPSLAMQVEGIAAVEGHAKVGTEAPYATTLEVSARPQLPDWPALPPLKLLAEGPLEQLQTRLRAQGDGDSVPLSIETTVRTLSTLPLRQASISLDRFQPQAFGLPGPQVTLAGTMQAQVDPAIVAAADKGEAVASLAELPWSGRLELRNETPGALDAGSVPVAALQTRFGWREGRLQLDELDVNRGTLSGNVAVDTRRLMSAFGLELPTVDARLALSGLDLSNWMSKATATRIGGSLALVGDAVSFDLRDTAATQLQASGKAQLQGNEVAIESLALRTHAGALTTRGRASTAEPWRADLQGSFERLTPARLARIAGIDMPAALSSLQGLGGEFAIDGELAPTLALDSRLALRQGSYEGKPLRIDWQGKVSLEQLQNLKLDARLGELRAQVQGDAGRAGDRLSLDVTAPDLSVLAPQLAGRLRVTGIAALPGLDAAALSAGTVDLKADGSGLASGETKLGALALSLQGTLSAHRLSADLKGPLATAQLAGTGALTLPGVTSSAARSWAWKGRIDRFASSQPLAVTLAQAMPLAADAAGASAGPASLRADGGRLDLARFSFRDGRFDVQGQAENLPVSRWSARFGLIPEEAARIDEVHLGGRWNLAGSGIEDLSGQADLRVRTGRTVDGDGSASLRFDRGAVAGSVDLRLPSLAFANRQLGPAWAVDGQARLRGQVSGRLPAPHIVGNLEGRDLVFVDRSMGWRLDRGVLDARFDGQRLHVEKMQLRSGEGSVDLAGSLLIDGMVGDFRLTTQALPILVGPGQRVVVTGDTGIRVRGNDFDWSGKLKVDDGLVEIGGGGAPSLPDDVKVVDTRTDTQKVAAAPDAKARAASGASPAARKTQTKQTKQAPPTKQTKPVATPPPADARPMRLSADLLIDLGGNLRVRGSGADVRLEGELRITGTLPEEPRASGTVRVREGLFSAYGQTLRISRGRVIFNGPLDNPALDLVAMRRGAVVEAGVAVGGTALSPRITLVSEPEVSDAEKLSWLVLGTSMGDARSGAQSAALSAAAATLFGSETLDGGLASKLGLDVLAIRNASDAGFSADFDARFPTQTGIANASTLGAANDVIAIGKRLGSRMLLSYEQGLKGVWSLVRLQYDITRRLTARAQTGTDTGVDLLYSFPFD